MYRCIIIINYDIHATHFPSHCNHVLGRILFNIIKLTYFLNIFLTFQTPFRVLCPKKIKNVIADTSPIQTQTNNQGHVLIYLPDYVYTQKKEKKEKETKQNAYCTFKRFKTIFYLS